MGYPVHIKHIKLSLTHVDDYHKITNENITTFGQMTPVEQWFPNAIRSNHSHQCLWIAEDDDIYLHGQNIINSSNQVHGS